METRYMAVAPGAPAGMNPDRLIYGVGHTPEAAIASAKGAFDAVPEHEWPYGEWRLSVVETSTDLANAVAEAIERQYRSSNWPTPFPLNVRWKSTTAGKADLVNIGYVAVYTGALSGLSENQRAFIYGVGSTPEEAYSHGAKNSLGSAWKICVLEATVDLAAELEAVGFSSEANCFSRTAWKLAGPTLADLAGEEK